MELFRALGTLIEPPDAAQADEVLRIARLLELADTAVDLPSAETYTDLFLFQLYPYASVYLGSEGMMGGEARDRIAGFLRTLGATPPTEPDHVAFLLAAFADLAAPDESLDQVSNAKAKRAREALLWEHLLSWLPAWLHGMRRLEPSCFYRRWADLLEDALRREAARSAGPVLPPLHFRETPPLQDPDEVGAEAFLQSLLAPARSGMVLVRADLRRAADCLHLGLRAGERKFALQHLLGQDAEGFLGWLADEAAAWSQYWRGQDWLGAVASAWAERAAGTEAVLRHARSSRPSA